MTVCMASCDKSLVIEEYTTFDNRLERFRLEHILIENFHKKNSSKILLFVQHLFLIQAREICKILELYYTNLYELYVPKVTHKEVLYNVNYVLIK